MRALYPVLLTTSVLAPAHAQTITFAAVADTGATTASTKVANLIKSRSPRFILAPGDLCYGTVPLSEQVGPRYGDYVAAARFWPAPGNHEYRDECGSGLRNYLSYFTLPNNERYYSKVIGPVHIFIVNSNPEEPDGRTADSKQAQWLRRRLASSTAPWKVVAFHHPPFSSGFYYPGTPELRWPFEAWGAHAVITGHEHHYERVMRDANNDGKRMPYFMTGLGGRSKRAFKAVVAGSKVRYSAQFGALFATATSTSLSFEFRNIDGKVIDRYNMSK